ncbi:MAG: aminotransferase class I/II-fold pyridoxal phosphate-dependent enzyme [Proteobacteria bacterium]|nr:aminotransferase class I/II-fold pyridoxal phosphate-dependent enzyme [Pseudomonadota bacterium]
MGIDDTRVSDNTLLVHDERHSEGAVAPPIYQTSLFTFESYQAMVDRFSGASTAPVYSRVDNPTVSVLLDKMCQLEQGEAAAAFSSGIGAISNAILGQVKSGDRIVCVEHVYPDTYRLLKGMCARFGVTTDFVDGRDLAAIEKALPGARIVYLESPNTWVMQEQDITSIAKMAKAEGVTSIVDNSWASPIYQKPLLAGIDLVVHSASKYISGHSDTVAGVLVGSKPIIDKLKLDTTPYLGAKLSAQEASLLLRGLRTLPLRMQRHQESALIIAKRLAEHSSVTRVHHPALAPVSYSLLKGYGGLFSFELGDEKNVPRFCDSLSLFRLGVSWGGHESLVMPAEASINQSGEHRAAVDFGVSPRTIRLFVGLEDPEELWSDLSQAFAGA